MQWTQVNEELNIIVQVLLGIIGRKDLFFFLLRCYILHWRKQYGNFYRNAAFAWLNQWIPRSRDIVTVFSNNSRII